MILLALTPLMVAPWPLLIVGFLCFVVGMLMLGITGLRTGLLPRSAAAMLIAAAILMSFFNTEDDWALMAIAPGITFLAIGARRMMSAR